jgi:ubiquinone/menaquinone biosynthesis C-methylase UbiE
VSDGIVDFVAGASSTELDNLDYDQFYSISEAASEHLFDIIKFAAGKRWPSSLGNAVEIGCGTGGFSSAVLRHIAADCVILTDVSSKMLGICRNRLKRLSDLQAETVLFATYSGTEACFRPGVLDTCFGTSVVHHVTDVPHLLAQIYRTLKPGGRAFFMEPNARFHAALTGTLAGILADWIRHETVPEPQISLMMNWMAEVNCNITNSGDLEILAQREDKHYFIGEDFEAMAEAAGFVKAAALVCNADPAGTTAIENYLGQVGVTEETLNLLRGVWPAAQRDWFRSLKSRDRSPSYLFWLEKGSGERPERRAVKRRQVAVADDVGAMRLWMMLSIERHENDIELIAHGWCVAAMAVRSVQFSLCGISHRLPIYLPRPDVHGAINADGTFPALHALCSGIDGRIRLKDVAAGGDPIAVDVEILTVDGRVVPKGRCMVVPDGDGVLVS